MWVLAELGEDGKGERAEHTLPVKGSPLARLLLNFAVEREGGWGRAGCAVWHERLNGAYAVVSALAVSSQLDSDGVELLVRRARRLLPDLDAAAQYLDAELQAALWA